MSLVGYWLDIKVLILHITMSMLLVLYMKIVFVSTTKLHNTIWLHIKYMSMVYVENIYTALYSLFTVLLNISDEHFTSIMCVVYWEKYRILLKFTFTAKTKKRAKLFFCN